MEKKAPPKRKNDPDKKKVEFHYIKGADFRAIHCDGVLGGVTPTGLVHLAVFSERHAIPKKIVHELAENDTLGPEIVSERDTIKGIVRQMEVDLFLTEDVVLTLRDWLNGRLEELKVYKVAKARALAKGVKINVPGSKERH